jgi:hypothetical protein
MVRGHFLRSTSFTGYLILFASLISLPITGQALSYLVEDVKIYPQKQKAFQTASTIFLIVVGVIGITELLLDSVRAVALSERAYFPTQAVTFLAHHPSQGQVFSTYEWGGYLDWKLPQKKVFIDGSMPTWSRLAANSHEESAVFQTYIDLSSGKVPFRTLAQKYDIDTVLIPSTMGAQKPLLASPPSWLQWLDQKNTHMSLERQLQQEGMQVIYRDKIAVIYRTIFR